MNLEKKNVILHFTGMKTEKNKMQTKTQKKIL